MSGEESRSKNEGQKRSRDAALLPSSFSAFEPCRYFFASPETITSMLWLTRMP